jgi:hypothetical protein
LRTLDGSRNHPCSCGVPQQQLPVAGGSQRLEVCSAAAATPNELPLGSTYLNLVSFRQPCADKPKGSAHCVHACAYAASCMHPCRLGLTGCSFIGEYGSGVCVHASACVSSIRAMPALAVPLGKCQEGGQLRPITSLKGTGTPHLDSSCPAQGLGCPAYGQRQYLPADVGLEDVLDLCLAPCDALFGKLRKQSP